MDRLTITLPGLPFGPNRLVKLHWSGRAKHHRQWRQDAYFHAVSARNQHGGRWPWERVRVTYEFGVPTRARRDPDNLVASGKPILDGIRDAGVIPDDSTGHVELGPPVVTHTPGRSSVRVHIERLGALGAEEPVALGDAGAGADQ